MNTDNALLIIFGIIIIAWPFMAFGLPIDIGPFGFSSLILGLILILTGLDRNRKEKKCPHCGWDRTKEGKKCPHCGFKFINHVFINDKKNKKIIIIVAYIVIAVTILSFAAQWIEIQTYKDAIEKMGSGPEGDPPLVKYEKNETARTITITSIEGEPDELLWSNVELFNPYNMYSMEATLPNGTIDVGDVITDCDGLVWLRWIPTGDLLIQDRFD